MRVTYLGAVPPLAGGVAQHGGQLVRALEELGHDVHVESWRSQYPAKLYPGDVQWRPDVERLQSASYQMRWWDPVSWWAAGRRSRSSDGLVVPWVVPAQAPALLTAMRAAACPTVVMVHNPIPHEPFPFAEALMRRVIGRAAGVVAHARQVAEQLGDLGAPVRDIRVVPHPPNLDITVRPLPKNEPLRLLTMGYVRPYKGVDLAVRALAGLVDSGVDAVLTVAGEAWDGGDELRALVTTLGVPDRVDLQLAYVPDDEVGDLLAAHHCLVLPYRHATQSGVIPLALAAGRPVVATLVGGLEDQLQNRRSGRLVPPNDVGALVSAIRDVANHRRAYGASAVAAGARWADVGQAVVDLLVSSQPES